MVQGFRLFMDVRVLIWGKFLLVLRWHLLGDMLLWFRV